MFDQYGGYGFGAPAPYFAPPQTYQQPVRQQTQPQPRPQPKPAKPQAAQISARVVVPTPDELGIALEAPPIEVPTPQELGIDLE